MMSDLNKSHGKFSDFVLFTLFGFTLVKKPEKKKDFFYQKMMSDLNMFCQKVSDLV